MSFFRIRLFGNNQNNVHRQESLKLAKLLPLKRSSRIRDIRIVSFKLCRNSTIAMSSSSNINFSPKEKMYSFHLNSWPFSPMKYISMLLWSISLKICTEFSSTMSRWSNHSPTFLSSYILINCSVLLHISMVLAYVTEISSHKTFWLTLSLTCLSFVISVPPNALLKVPYTRSFSMLRWTQRCLYLF